jgi:predicted Zn finger-like uncharacterized protein
MRLICPNCGAQYEVDAAMIPDEGRDVQCSACGQTWFQPPEGVEPAPPEPDADTASPTSDDAVPDEPASEEEDTTAYGAGSEVGGDEEWPAEPETVAEETDSVEEASDDTLLAEDEAEDESEISEEEQSGEPAREEPSDEVAAAAAVAAVAAASSVRPSERLDEDSLRVLREEAEREAAARRAEQAQTLETQPELGLPEAEEPRARIHEDDTDEDDAALPGSRGDMLPDIDQINSTLRPASEHPETKEVADPAVVEAQHRSGFRWGFTLMIVIAALLVIAYVFAPQIARQSPAVEPAISGYVETVNGLRDQVEGFLSRTTESLSGDGE